MHICQLCRKEEVPPRRWALGIHHCLSCGESLADKERAAKAKRVSLAYSKGPYMYMGSNASAKNNLNDSTDKRRSTESAANMLPVRVARELNRTPTAAKPRAIGIYYAPGERNGTFYFSEDDPNLATASRKMRFDGK